MPLKIFSITSNCNLINYSHGKWCNCQLLFNYISITIYIMYILYYYAYIFLNLHQSGTLHILGKLCRPRYEACKKMTLCLPFCNKIVLEDDDVLLLKQTSFIWCVPTFPTPIEIEILVFVVTINLVGVNREKLLYCAEKCLFQKLRKLFIYCFIAKGNIIKTHIYS